MGKKDVSWVQLDISEKNIKKLSTMDLEGFFYPGEEPQPTQTNVPVTRNDVTLLNSIMNSLGYELVRVETIIGREKLLYAWTSERWYPLKQAYYVASLLAHKAGIDMRGILVSGEWWLHMLEVSDNGKVLITPTISLQHKLNDGSYIIHDEDTKKVLIRIDNNLLENDRDVLVASNKDFIKFFETIDYALTTLVYQ